MQELRNFPLRSPQPSDSYYGRDDFLAKRQHRAATLLEKHHLRYIPGPIPEVAEKDVKVPMRDGAEIMLRIYNKEVEPSTRGKPLIMMFHEGGWSMGDLTDEEVNCRMLCRDLGAVCMNVDYRLAPEHPFPTGIDDCWDALKWAAGNATVFGADPTQGFIVGGGSAGGNIAAVLAHLARDNELYPPLTGQYLCVPAIMCFAQPSQIPPQYRDEYLSHPSVTPVQDPVLKPLMDNVGDFIRDIVKADISDALFAPFNYGKSDKGHTGLCPAYFQICGLDPLRDEGLIYERVLREEAGVKTKLDLYSGYGHYFWTNFPRMDMSRRFVEDTREGIRWLLARKLD